MAYHSPKTMEEAFAALNGPDVAVIAGGTDWFPQSGDRLTDKSLLDVTGLPGFRGIARTSDGWRIGAATTWTDIINADLPACFDGLKAAAKEVGSLQIQNTGTVAGNLCNASPAADGVPPLLTLNAQIELISVEGTRTIPLTDFITGVRRTTLAPRELVAAILIPDTQSFRAGFLKLGSRRYMVISIAMVAALIRTEGGRIVEARVAAGACSPVAIRLPALEQRLIGHCAATPVAITEADLAPLSPLTDLRGSGLYRLQSVDELLHRLITDLTAAE